MKVILLLGIFMAFFSCKKNSDTSNSIQYSTVSYNAIYNPASGNSSSFSFNDSFYTYRGPNSIASGLNGCLLVPGYPPSQQPNYSYYIGSRYDFSLGNSTTYGIGTTIPYNAYGYLGFSIPTDSFINDDSIPINKNLFFKGGSHSLYTICGAGWNHLTKYIYLMPLGDSQGGAETIPFTGNIDSGEIHLIISRFSDNGIRPNSKIKGTMDGTFSINFYGTDGSSVNITDGFFKNVLVQQN